MERQVLLGRQPILNLNRQIEAYELLYRSLENSLTVGFDPHLATAMVVQTALSDIGMDSVLGDKRAFVNVTAEVLAQDWVMAFPPERVVFELLETITPTPELLARCRELKGKGYKIALDDFVYGPEWDDLLKISDYLKVDVRASSRDVVVEYVRLAEKHKVIPLAEKVETQAEYEWLKGLGYRLFQGYFFARPVTLSAKEMPANKLSTMRLLNLLLDDETETAAIVDELHKDFSLTYRLLKYLNSAGMMGARGPVDSLNQAVMILGRRGMYRWVSLMLFAGEGRTAGPSPLMQTALYRGRMVELLCSSACKSGQKCSWQDTGFLVGLFSLLEALFEKPMEAILQELVLPEEVAAALLGRKGDLGELLQLVEGVDQGDLEAVSKIMEHYQINTDAISEKMLDAMAWVESVTGEKESSGA